MSPEAYTAFISYALLGPGAKLESNVFIEDNFVSRLDLRTLIFPEGQFIYYLVSPNTYDKLCESVYEVVESGLP